MLWPLLWPLAVPPRAARLWPARESASVCVYLCALSAFHFPLVDERTAATRQTNKQTTKRKQTWLSRCRPGPVTKVSSLLVLWHYEPVFLVFFQLFSLGFRFHFHFSFSFLFRFLSVPVLAKCASNIILQLPDEEVVRVVLSVRTWAICGSPYVISTYSPGAHMVE